MDYLFFDRHYEFQAKLRTIEALDECTEKLRHLEALCDFCVPSDMRKIFDSVNSFVE